MQWIAEMSTTTSERLLAVVTDASSGIGFETACRCAAHRYDLVIAADERFTGLAGETVGKLEVDVAFVEAGLAAPVGLDALFDMISARPADALPANAGHGPGRAFLDRDFDESRHVIDTDTTGTLYLVQSVGVGMLNGGNDRFLITGSIAGLMLGAFEAVHNGSMALTASFSFALRNELQGSGVTVTCLMPGAMNTHFFRRADMLDTKVEQSEKDVPAEVARIGFHAMLDGEGDMESGWENKVQAARAHVTPAAMLAEQQRKIAEMGSDRSHGR